MKVKFGDLELRMHHEGFFDKTPALFVMDLPTKKDFRRGTFPEITNNRQIYIFVKPYQLDIKVETTFDVILPYSNIYDFVKTKVTLKYSSVNPSYELDYIPRGYGSLCLFEFEKEIPEIIYKLPFFPEAKKPENESLVFTQQPLLDVLFEHANRI